eukprot:1899077-Amphidinium_carterae.1
MESTATLFAGVDKEGVETIHRHDQVRIEVRASIARPESAMEGRGTSPWVYFYQGRGGLCVETREGGCP